MVTTEQGTTEVRVPDIGDYSDVPVIEVLVRVGDLVNVDDPLVTLESDKATMDIPAPVAGTVAGVLVTVGDRVSEGTPIAVLQPGDGALRQPPSLMVQQEPEPVVEPEPAVATRPSLRKATAFTAPSWKRNTCSAALRLSDQRMAEVSKLPEIAVSPSGATATARTGPPWPRSWAWAAPQASGSSSASVRSVMKMARVRVIPFT